MQLPMYKRFKHKVVISVWKAIQCQNGVAVWYYLTLNYYVSREDVRRYIILCQNTLQTLLSYSFSGRAIFLRNTK
jgi:hypothetical protein